MGILHRFIDWFRPRGGILSGPEIARQVRRGNIVLDPFSPEHVNPNSYNLRLGRRIKMFIGGDCCFSRFNELEPNAEPNAEYNLEDGQKFTFHPGNGYLCHTEEIVGTTGYAPKVDGRSSVGRMFTLVHCTAGFIDDAFTGQITLEIVPLISPVTFTVGDEICQVSFSPIIGKRQPYQGRYQGDRGPVESRMWKGK